MKQTIRAMLVGLSLAATSGCVVLEPADGAVQSPEAAVAFSGYAALPGQAIELEARGPGGAFAPFASTTADTTALVLDDGTRLYPWQTRAVVPHWEGAGCDRTAEVRAVGVFGRRRKTLFTFDEAGAECVGTALETGTPLLKALDDCAASTGGQIELSAGSGTHVGDVLVTTQAEADALACATVIDGNLSVVPTEAVVSFPNLQEITGSLSIEVEDGMPDGMGFVESEQVDLPLLQTLGGDLTFHHVDATNNVGVQLGLPLLTTAPGDVDLLLSSFNGYNIGLAGLQSIAGNLTIEARGDFYAPNLLTALTAVTGDVHVSTSGAGSSASVLNGLQTVGGSLTLDSLRSLNYSILEALTAVGGDFTLHRSFSPFPHLPALTSVGGTLAVTESQNFGLPPGNSLGGASLTMGALLLDGSYFDAMFFPVATTVAPSGAITITDNGALCQDDVDDFVADQQAAGWMGTLSVSNNTGSCAP